jgi:hypothetical protein
MLADPFGLALPHALALGLSIHGEEMPTVGASTLVPRDGHRTDTGQAWDKHGTPRDAP